ncbi:respiratory nitrate reductase subunit gamma [Mangrovactinospora gilvigrisea]|uniref:Nitrate reductase-like protein NarX n=1 Tax=Mangrovactinospora gilvigrisea TaxID=1428644 RepID=A0A1J7C5F5_9ACTN|nr:respiratory nitrate reductase subunit gamma [Mangrovactinospora gilvigrisea]OIV36780.1 respiratory nitrate reductase subunit gamma [Mangrovactinospora gilvigrisea]
MTSAGLLLWGVLPYVCLVALIGGTVWRHRYDKFGWTTRSSELYEKRLLRIASPLFHYGIIGAFFGHILGVVIPKSWIDGIGIDEHAYHLIATWLGIPAGLAALAGLAMLIVRRRTTGSVFDATTNNDKVMYVVLLGAICLGLAATFWNAAEGPYDYRTSVSVWFRSVFYGDPKIALMSATPIVYRIHAAVGMVLIGMFPFTRLIHAFAAPVFYMFRPYIVYRSRDARQLGARSPQRGWERVR